MPRKPIDLEAVRRADEKLKKLLEEHPELREPNPERQEALEAWLQGHLDESDDLQDSHQSQDEETDNGKAR